MRREFTFQDDASNKFWTIEVVDNAYVTTNGRIGAKPRETRKEFADADTAHREAEKLVSAKVKSGYVEGPIASVRQNDPVDWAAMTMSEEVFWRIIKLFRWKKTGDDDAVLEPARVALAKMAIDDIHRFEAILAEKLYALDTKAHAQNSGENAFVDDETHFSVDLFLYARCCVVANGAEFYNKVLRDPTEMPKDMDFESILYLAGSAYQTKTGEEMSYHPPCDYETFSNSEAWE